MSTSPTLEIRPLISRGLFTATLSPGSVVRFDEPLARRTTMRIGGPADVYVEPGSEQDLAGVVRFCRDQHVPWIVLGRGSNMLFRDGGFAGVVISLNHKCFAQIDVDSPRLACGAGAKLKDVANRAKAAGITGFEFLEGIPGTVGGALRMNAGAMGSATFELVQTVRVMNSSGEIFERKPAEMNVAYRKCIALKEHIALSAVLLGMPGERGEIEGRMASFSQKRWSTQPAVPSAGCMFKNPATIPAGKLIDELGLKGTKVGGATVSLKHGNFIVNEGNATAKDICQLIAIVKEKARAERGIELETEVEIVGRE